MRVIVAGSRGFNDYELMKEKLLLFFSNLELEDIEIVSGTASGADKLGEKFAKEHGCSIKRFPAEWNEYGRKAGMIRNNEMADYADACVCFWDGHSKGTAGMARIADRKGLNLRIVIETD